MSAVSHLPLCPECDHFSDVESSCFSTAVVCRDGAGRQVYCICVNAVHYGAAPITPISTSEDA